MHATAAEAERAAADLDARDARNRAAALGVDDDVGEREQIGHELILQQRREVARAAHRQDAAQPRAAHVGFEEDAVLMIVDVAGGAADAGLLHVGEELDLTETAIALLHVSLPNAPGNDVVPTTAMAVADRSGSRRAVATDVVNWFTT